MQRQPPSPQIEENLFLTISEDLAPSAPPVESAIIALSFSGLLSPPLQLQTNVSECGGKMWPAGMVLSEYLIQHHLDEMRGKKILELGAGSGLVGLAVAMALEQKPFLEPLEEATTIYLTDGMPSLVPLIDANITLNRLSSSPNATTSLYASLLPWGDPLPSRISMEQKPDIILAADCVYFEPAFPLLEKTIDESMGEETMLWFCYLRRRKRDGEMIKRLDKIGLDVQEADTGELGRSYGRAAGYGAAPGEGRGKGGVVLYKVRRRREESK